MPAEYEAIRDRFLRDGYSETEAKRHAARIFNAAHRNNPVGPRSDQQKPESLTQGVSTMLKPRPKGART